jgi:hypothetical protein
MMGQWDPQHIHVVFGGLRNIIITLIKLHAFVGLNCNNWIEKHGMQNVKTGIATFIGIADSGTVLKKEMINSEHNE